MCGNFKRSEHIELVEGMLWRYIYCEGKKPEFLVAKVCEDGKQMSRNIEYCGMFGWRYVEPGREFCDFDGKFIAKVDEWGDFTPSLENFCIEFPSEEDKMKILSKYPDFQWVLKKTDWTIAKIFKALPLWKKDARLMETLCSIGCHRLALNGSFYKAVDRWDIVKWLSHNEQHRSKSLEDIRLMRKFCAVWEEIEKYRSEIRRYNYVSFEEWRYLQGKPKYQDEYFYNDYRKMCNEVGHDFKDPYWHFPKNLKKQHDKVMDAYESRIKELEDVIKVDDAIRITSLENEKEHLKERIKELEEENKHLDDMVDAYQKSEALDIAKMDKKDERIKELEEALSNAVTGGNIALEQAKKLESQFPKWISVKDRFPCEDGEYQVVYKHKN